MSKDERAAKVAEIEREMSWPATVRRDAENIRALLAIVAELERENAELRGWASQCPDPMGG